MFECDQLIKLFDKLLLTTALPLPCPRTPPQPSFSFYPDLF